MIKMQWQYLFSLTAMILFILHSSPVLAVSRVFSPRENKSNYSMDTTIIADDYLLKTKQKQSQNLLHKLNLTREQQQKIRQIHDQYKQQIHHKKNALIVLQRQLSDMMAGTEPVKLIRAKNQQLVVLQREIGELRFESMLATREILTPQQRQKFRELVKSRLSQ